MQILIYIEETLSTYYEIVKSRGISSLIGDYIRNYKECCPICEGKDCIKFIGYYSRGAVTELGESIPELPIGRIKCNEKGKKK